MCVVKTCFHPNTIRLATREHKSKPTKNTLNLNNISWNKHVPTVLCFSSPPLDMHVLMNSHFSMFSCLFVLSRKKPYKKMLFFLGDKFVLANSSTFSSFFTKVHDDYGRVFFLGQASKQLARALEGCIAQNACIFLYLTSSGTWFSTTRIMIFLHKFCNQRKKKKT